MKKKDFQLGDIVSVQVKDDMGDPYEVAGRIIQDTEGKQMIEYMVAAKQIFYLDEFIKKHGKTRVKRTGYFVRGQEPLQRDVEVSIKDLS